MKANRIKEAIAAVQKMIDIRQEYIDWLEAKGCMEEAQRVYFNMRGAEDALKIFSEQLKEE